MSKELNINREHTIIDVLAQRIASTPDRLWVVDGDERLTYEQMGVRIDQVAAALLQLGIEPQEKVAIAAAGSILFTTTLYAVLKIGAVAVPVNVQLRPQEIEYILDDSDAVAVVVAEKVWNGNPLENIHRIRPALTKLRNVIVSGNPLAEDDLIFEDLVAATGDNPDFPILDPAKLAVLIYTSGTTGVPKGSMHTHQTLLYNHIARLEQRKSESPFTKIRGLVNLLLRHGPRYLSILNQPATTLLPVPPHTATGFLPILSVMVNGNTMVVMDRITPMDILRLIDKEKVTAFVTVPTMAMFLFRNPDLDKYDLSSLQIMVLIGAPVPPELASAIEKRMNCAVMIGFGTTELGANVSGTNLIFDPKKMLSETVGKINKGWEAKVVDEERRTLPSSEVGELAIRGGGLMLGYYKADELTRQTIDEDGWYYTGDLATIDKDGFIRIVGRKKDMIIRGGQNIYPAEIEAVLDAHPKIYQSAVVGVPDMIAGEKVLAFVIPEEGVDVSKIEIMEYCRERMAAYRVPGDILFETEFPVNATGKVQKFVLRQKIMQQTG